MTTMHTHLFRKALINAIKQEGYDIVNSFVSESLEFRVSVSFAVPEGESEREACAKVEELSNKVAEDFQLFYGFPLIAVMFVEDFYRSTNCSTVTFRNLRR